MFTGLIKSCGRITKFVKTGNMALLEVSVMQANFLENIEKGSSVNIDGVCLTVTEVLNHNNKLRFFVSEQTLKNTILNYAKINNIVNLERPLRLASPLDGHLVLGHTDVIGTVKRVIKHGESMELFIEILKDKLKYIVEKGSVSLNGVSLTVQKKTKDGFYVMIIPETYRNTNLKYLKPNAKVNIEFDIIGKYVAEMIR